MLIQENLKQCTACREFLPARENFHSNRTTADGYHGYCRGCVKRTHQAQQLALLREKGIQYCQYHKTYHGQTEFDRSSIRATGLRVICREAESAKRIQRAKKRIDQDLANVIGKLNTPISTQ